FPSQGFKWFGSLTNLSFRRNSEKSDSKTQQKSGAGAGSVPEDGTDCDAVLDPVPETTVDDMDAIRPRTASYVRSSESYSHMGTLPRLLMRKRDKTKSSKGAPSSSKNSKDKSSISRSQSQRPAGDRGAQRLKTGLRKDSLPILRTQPEPIPKTRVTNTQDTTSTPTAVCKDESPSGGSTAALQPEQGVPQEGADLNPEESASPPAGQEDDQTQTHEDDGLQSEPVSEPKKEEESTKLTKGANKRNQNSDSTYW
ncbi:hypothetical protein GBF38_009782, partial [Nibea albiflora]